MRKIVLSLVVPVLLIMFSCASVTTGPEGLSFMLGELKPPIGEELKLLSIDILHSGNLSADVEYWAHIEFAVRARVEIDKACFNFSGDRQKCVDIQVKDAIYGSHPGAHPYFRVPIQVPADAKRIDCYFEYTHDGTSKRTNTVTYHFIVRRKPVE
jgi:hypothetical protein